jgi:small subunit ribosomal protein S18
MAQRREKKAPPGKERRPIKKKTSILITESIDYIDYKDVNLLRRFMSERAKVRARRVTGNTQQQQVAIAKAIRVAREMALLPYSVRQVTQRSKGRRDRGDRGDRGELRLPSSAPSSSSSSSSSAEVDNEAVLGELDTDLETTESFNGNGDGESTLAEVTSTDADASDDGADA